MTPLDEDIKKNGFAVTQGLFNQQELTLLENFSALIEARVEEKGGGRNIFQNVPELLNVLKSDSVLKFVNDLLGPQLGVSEGLYLNKKDEANWLVSWHQDLFVHVQKQIQREGYKSWTLKQGLPYVQSPTEVLEQSLWLRLNLDDNDIDNGCLRVSPGTHRLGKMVPEDIASVVKQRGDVAIPCRRGDIILFKPLLLHASSKSLKPCQRRVFQVLFSGFQFENGLQWPYYA